MAAKEAGPARTSRLVDSDLGHDAELLEKSLREHSRQAPAE
ncbi:hypothetical protein [Streptomyces misionensis]|nr:hypothetical protein [Streptomyces misionensis]